MIEPLKYKRQSRVVKKINEIIDQINGWQPTALDTKQEKCPANFEECEICGHIHANGSKCTGTMGEGKKCQT